MNKTLSSTLAGLVLTVVAGCQSLGAPLPTTAREPAPGVIAEASHTPKPVASLADVVVGVTTETAPVAVATCSAEADKHGYYGFYAKDAWDAGHVVLTFDDGPHPTATPRVLDLLQKEKMPATFFLIGRNISRETYPLVQRMVAEGHTIGSHSYSHDVHMANVATPRETVETIRGQHEVTSMMIDLAMMARSGDDFDAMFRQDFASDPAVWMTETQIRKDWRADLERHQALLATRGFDHGARPYTVLYSRPPGGGPYVEHDGAAGIALYDEALSKLGMMNVLWHGASGDTVPGQRGDFGFLTKNIDHYAKTGGVILIHDYIRPDALTQSLSKIAGNGALEVVSMQDAVQKKYACSPASLGQKLSVTAAADTLGRGLFTMPTADKTVETTFALAR